MKNGQLQLTFLVILFSFLILSDSTAHGIAINKRTGKALKLSESKIDVKINNQIARVQSSQVYYYESGNPVQIKYGFPLDEESNPIELRWKVNSNPWSYAEANSAVQDSSIPSSGGGGGSGTGSTSAIDAYLGDNPLLFSPADFISEGDSLTIEITYVKLLTYDSGIVSYDYPGDFSSIQSHDLDLLSYSFELISDRTIDAFDITGLSNMTINNDGNLATAVFATEEIGADSDLNLSYVLSSEELGVEHLSTMLPDSMVTCDAHGGGFVSFIIEPESNEDVEVIQKNFTLIIDKSGSMRGDKIEQAREAASFIVNNLNDGDRFNIITFSTTVTSLFTEHQEYNDSNKDQALEFISNTDALGSTNISGSLSEAIGQFDASDLSKANIIIFFTDGKATSGIRNTNLLLDFIDEEAADAETNIFLFTFGVGDDVDKLLLSTLAVNNNGLVNFLEEENLEEEITDFFLKINNPVLLDINLTVEPDLVYEIYPSKDKLPNLYKGQQLIISGRYNVADTSVNMKLTGKAFNLDVEYDFQINLSGENLEERSFLPKIWAKQKIDDLRLSYFLEEDNVVAQSIQEEIDSTSICYGVVSLDFNRFVDGTTLAVEHLSFDATVIDESYVLLEWSTASEQNNDAFIIERSRDGENWEAIGQVSGAGTSKEVNYYTFRDDNPPSGVSYYRVKEVDLNGEIGYSIIKAINFNPQEDLMLYPNPALAGQNITIQSAENETLSVAIMNNLGQLIKKEEIQNGLGTIALDPTMKGVYLFYIESATKNKIYKVLIK